MTEHPKISHRDVLPELAVFAIAAVTWLSGAVLLKDPSLKLPFYTYGTLAALVVYGGIKDPYILSRQRLQNDD